MQPNLSPTGNSRDFAAPWGTALKVISASVSLLFFGMAVVSLVIYRGNPTGIMLLTCLPLLIVVICGLFSIRGYVLTGNQILVRRPLWDTSIPLESLQAASLETHAMRGAIRAAGNGGLFSFSGLFWSKKRGFFRVWVTDLKHCVVLRFPKRTVVISPANPELFLQSLPRPENVVN